MKNVANRILNLLGLAKRAQKIAVGDFATETAIKKNRATMIIAAEDASARTVEKYRLLSEEYSIPFAILFTKEELGKAVGKDGFAATVALTDVGFAASAEKLLATEGN